MVDQVTDNSFILLDVMEAELSAAGTYECRVVFTDNSTTNNISMGSLTVVGMAYIQSVYGSISLPHPCLHGAITLNSVMDIDLRRPPSLVW